MDAHALWFAGANPTVNFTEMAALVWGFELLMGWGVKEHVLVLGDAWLSLGFCTCKAAPSKPDLYKGLKRITELRK